MKIAIPTEDKKLNGKVADHFGRCNYYIFLDEEGKVIEIVDNTSKHKGDKLPPELIKNHGADVLLCKGIGPKALDLCKQLGIDVYVSESKTVKEIFEKWKNGKIKKASFEDVCKR